MTSGQLDAERPCNLVKGCCPRRENGGVMCGGEVVGGRAESGWLQGWGGAGTLPPLSSWELGTSGGEWGGEAAWLLPCSAAALVTGRCDRWLAR